MARGQKHKNFCLDSYGSKFISKNSFFYLETALVLKLTIQKESLRKLVKPQVDSCLWPLNENRPI